LELFISSVEKVGPQKICKNILFESEGSTVQAMARLHGRGHVSDRLPLLALLPLLSLLILFEQHHHHHEAEAVGDAVTIPHWNPFKTHTCPAQNQNLNQNQPQYKLKHIIGRKIINK
jgi:hypothetical protein